MTTPLPHSPAEEAAMVGALLLAPDDALPRVESVCSPDDCHDPFHAAVYRAVQALSAKRSPIDPLTVSSALEEEGKTGWADPARLAGLAGAVPTAENAAHYAGIVRDRAQRRRMIEVSAQLRGRALAMDAPADDEIQAGIDALRGIFSGETGVVPIQQTLDEVMTEIRDRTAMVRAGQEADLAPLGVPTGFKALDDDLLVHGGLPTGQLTLLVADTSVGKSSLAIDFELNLCVSASLSGVSVLDCTLEDSRYSRVKRALTHLSLIKHREIQRGVISPQNMEALEWAEGHLRGANIYHMGRQDRTVERMCARARRHIQDKGASLWVIDYLQLLRTERRFQNRNDKVEYVMEQVLDVAMDSPETATLAISTLREGDYEASIPSLNDIPYSKQQKYDVYTFMALSRLKKGKGLPCVWVEILKQKDGRRGGCVLGWHEPTASFHDPDEGQFVELLRRKTNVHGERLYNRATLENLAAEYEKAIGVRE